MLVVWMAVIVLGLAAVGGLTLATMHWARQPAPLWAALVHGGAALAGVGFLVWEVAVLQAFRGLGAISLLLFALAALGGAYLFTLHSKRRELPRAVIAAHGLTALTAYVLLLIYAFG
jgi:hypothetical protein